MNKHELLKELLVDEDKFFKELVEKSKELIGIGSKTGETYIQCNKNKLSTKDIISLHLIGSYFAHELQLKDSMYSDRTSLAKNIGSTEKIVSARISDLRKDNLIDTNENGEYGIIISKITEQLEYIKKKVE